MHGKNVPEKYSKEEIKESIALLEALVKDSSQLLRLTEQERVMLLKAAGELSRPHRDEIKKRNKDLKQAKRQRLVKTERLARAATGIRQAREAEVFTAPGKISDQSQPFRQYTELKSPRNCYICKAEYKDLHFFYDALCPSCAEFNYKKRFQSASLDGQVALITGARLKIGYQSTLKLLRAGARVIATTRFPHDAALRYAKEKDYAQWAGQLHIYGLDLRHTPSVEIFCSYIERTYDRLDILINNAAQTVRRPPQFYAHLMEFEKTDFDRLPEKLRLPLGHYNECKRILFKGSALADSEALTPLSWNGKVPGIGLARSAGLSQIPYTYDHSLNKEELFPAGKLDVDLQQVDLRKTNSWRLRLGEIPVAEMLELQLINAIAPFVLCNRLLPLMKRDKTGKKHIVNVSAMEGKFLRYKKDGRHPHTNMAKAALNMLTHSSAGDLAEYGIFMNAVDTGWVTDEDPAVLAERKQAVHDFQPPLDIVDGAARVCDPFFDGILSGKHWSGKFLKDYFPIDW